MTTLPIGYSAPPMTMNQLLGVTAYNPTVSGYSSYSSNLPSYSPLTASAPPSSYDYTKLSTSTLMALGQNPYARQGIVSQVQSGYYPSSVTSSPYPINANGYPLLANGSQQDNLQQLLQSSANQLPTVPNSLYNVPGVQQALPSAAPFLGQLGNTPLLPQTNLQQLQAQTLQAQILQITADQTLPPEIKAVRIKDLQLQFQNLQVVANTGTNIQDQINQITYDPNIPPEAKQQLIGQLTGQIQQTTVNSLAPQQPDIFKILLGSVARSVLPGLLKPGEKLQDNVLLGTAATLASVFTGVDLVTGVERPAEKTESKNTEPPTTKATYKDGNKTVIVTSENDDDSAIYEQLLA